jgi:uncharacterized protein (DUF1778 family)
MANTKDARLAARLTHEQDELLRWAASTRGVPVSSFVLDAALERATRIQVLEQYTHLPSEQMVAFTAWLDESATHIPEMKRLAEAEPFESR